MHIFVGRRSRQRLGIIPRLLIASLLAVVVAVVAVQTWTLQVVGEYEDRAAQVKLETSLGVLKLELAHRGGDWRLSDDGRLILDGKPADGLQDAVETVGRITHGVVTVFAGDKRVATTVTKPDGSRAVGTVLAPGPARDAVIDNARTYRGMADILGLRYLAVYEPLRDRDGRPIGILFVGVEQQTVQTTLNKIISSSALIALLVIACVSAGLWLLLRSALRPLSVLAQIVHAIGDGNFDLAVPCTDRSDQLGEIGRAVASLGEKARHSHELEARAAAERTAQSRRQEAMDLLTQDFGTSVSGVLANLVDSSDNMRLAADDMALAAKGTSEEMAVTASDADASSQNLSRVAAAAEELTSSVAEISRQVDHAAAAAREAVEQAEATDETVRGLGGAASQIDEVVGLINSIAGQTNLLALNATIEAARAGDAGKGFAVVASEVKQLATQTAQATGRIASQIAAIQRATAQAATAVREAMGAIGKVSEVSTAIASAVEEQGAATREIASQVNAVAQATSRATRAMQHVSASAEKSGATSQTVQIAADQIMRVSGRLREDVDHFVTAMRRSQERGERRKYERIPGRNTKVRLRHPTHGSGTAEIVDISLGGVALNLDWRLDVGSEIQVGLPAGDAEVSARVVGERNGILALAFRQDPDTNAKVNRVLERIAAQPADTPASIAA